jgi:SAM-dependent methyltransferase
MTEETRFDRTAERYAAQSAKRDWEPFIAICKPQPGDRALDVGAGPGFLSAALLNRVAEAVALEPSEAMLSHAPAGVKGVVGSALDMSFADASFDLVTCVNSLHHLPDPHAALREIARVLAPGGRFAIQDYLRDPDPVEAERWDAIERVRDPGHGRLPAEGEVAEVLAPFGIVPAEQVERPSSWETAAWNDIAGLDPETAEHIHGLIGADSFTLRMWRARFERTD